MIDPANTVATLDPALSVYLVGPGGRWYATGTVGDVRQLLDIVAQHNATVRGAA